MKERAQLEEMYYRGNCPWMVWDPERSGAAKVAAAEAGWRPAAVPDAGAVMLALRLGRPAGAAVGPRDRRASR